MIAQFVVLALMGAVIGFEIYAIIEVVRSPLKGRWKWILLCLVGVTQVHAAWGASAFWFSPISVSFLGVSALKSGVGPWVISASFPVGAIIALQKVDKTKAEGAVEI